MSLYPAGHEPFRAHGLILDQLVTDGVQELAAEPSLKRCLDGAARNLDHGRLYLELLRANLFRAEALIEKQPLPARDLFILLPHDLPALLETLNAAQTCVEEWLESTTCARILAKYPTRPKTPPLGRDQA